jgi:hypothetical protein
VSARTNNNSLAYLYMAEENKKEDSDKERRITIRFRPPIRIPTVFADHLTVQPGPDGVTLSFYEAVLPVIPPNATEEQIKEIEESGVFADCVSKIFVPGSRYGAFVGAMKSIIPDSAEAEEEGK